MADYTITLDDSLVPALEFKRDESNSQRDTKLSTAEFIEFLIADWARHAETKRQKDVASQLLKAFNQATPEERIQLSAQAQAIIQRVDDDTRLQAVPAPKP